MSDNSDSYSNQYIELSNVFPPNSSSTAPRSANDSCCTRFRRLAERAYNASASACSAAVNWIKNAPKEFDKYFFGTVDVSTVFPEADTQNEILGSLLKDKLLCILTENQYNSLKYKACGSYFVGKSFLTEVIRSLAAGLLSAEVVQAVIVDNSSSTPAETNQEDSTITTLRIAAGVAIPLVFILQKLLGKVEQSFIDKKLNAIKTDVQNGNLTPKVKQFLLDVLIKAKAPRINKGDMAVAAAIGTGYTGVNAGASLAASAAYGAAIGIAADSLLNGDVAQQSAQAMREFDELLKSNKKETESKGNAVAV